MGERFGCAGEEFGGSRGGIWREGAEGGGREASGAQDRELGKKRPLSAGCGLEASAWASGLPLQPGGSWSARSLLSLLSLSASKDFCDVFIHTARLRLRGSIILALMLSLPVGCWAPGRGIRPARMRPRSKGTNRCRRLLPSSQLSPARPYVVGLLITRRRARDIGGAQCCPQELQLLPPPPLHVTGSGSCIHLLQFFVLNNNSGFSIHTLHTHTHTHLLHLYLGSVSSQAYKQKSYLGELKFNQN